MFLKNLLNEEISNGWKCRQFNKTVKASRKKGNLWGRGRQWCRQLSTLFIYTANHKNNRWLNFMHRLGIMVLAISIVLYHTIKKLVAKKKGCRSDKIHLFRKCHRWKSLLGHTYRHMYPQCGQKKFCLKHTHTRNKYILSLFGAGQNTKWLLKQLMKIPLCHAVTHFYPTVSLPWRPQNQKYVSLEQPHLFLSFRH